MKSEYDGMAYEIPAERGTEVTEVRIGDRLIVGWLSLDEYPENPMKAWDGNGTLYTKPQRYARDSSITDDSDWHGYLGLNGDGEPDLELDAVAERTFAKLKEIMTTDMKADMVRIMLQAEAPAEECLDAIWERWSNGYDTWEWDEDDQAMFDTLPDYRDTAYAAWNELYDEGKIGDHLAVPVDYSSSNHGPGTASAYTTDLDSCNAVWVPGEDEIGNMTFLKPGIEVAYEGNGGGTTGMQFVVRDKGEYIKGFDNYGEALLFAKKTYPHECTYREKLKVAEKYAQGVLDVYISWCNGDVWSVNTAIFVSDGIEWVEEESDSCGGFYGMEDAENSLRNEYIPQAVHLVESYGVQLELI